MWVGPCFSSQLPLSSTAPHPQTPAPSRLPRRPRDGEAQGLRAPERNQIKHLELRLATGSLPHSANKHSWSFISDSDRNLVVVPGVWHSETLPTEPIFIFSLMLSHLSYLDTVRQGKDPLLSSSHLFQSTGVFPILVAEGSWMPTGCMGTFGSPK